MSDNAGLTPYELGSQLGKLTQAIEDQRKFLEAIASQCECHREVTQVNVKHIEALQTGVRLLAWLLVFLTGVAGVWAAIKEFGGK